MHGVFKYSCIYMSPATDAIKLYCINEHYITFLHYIIRTVIKPNVTQEHNNALHAYKCAWTCDAV